VVSVADKIGCAPQTLHEGMKKAEVDSGKRAGVPTDTAGKPTQPGAFRHAAPKGNGWRILQLSSGEMVGRKSCCARERPLSH